MVQEFRHCPDVVCDTRRQRGPPLVTSFRAETSMGRTEGVPPTNHIHALADGRCAARRDACAPPEDRQAAAKRPVQAFDAGPVQHLTARRAPQQRLVQTSDHRLAYTYRGT
jgi:hypothetical protein